MNFNVFSKRAYGIELTDYQKNFIDFLEWCKEHKHTLPLHGCRASIFNLTYQMYLKDTNGRN